MFKLFTKKGPGAIGLDISDHSVEAVQLNQDGGALRLLAWSRQMLPSGLRQKGQILDGQKFAAFLRDFLVSPKFGRFVGTDLVVNVPEERVLTQTIDFSPPIKQDIEASIIERLSLVVPADPKALAWDWQETFRSQIKQEIFWAGINKEFVTELKGVFKSLGMNLVAVDLESAALARATVQEVPAQKAVLLVDIGSASTFIAIYDQYGIRSTYNVDRGGHFFTQEIARQLNMPLKEAEIKKRQWGFTTGAERGKLLSILQAATQMIVEEMVKSIRFYESRAGQKVVKIVLSGGSSLIPNIDFHLAQQVQLEVEKAKLWINFSQNFPENLPALFPISVGLALRGLAEFSGNKIGINLLKKV